MLTRVVKGRKWFKYVQAYNETPCIARQLPLPYREYAKEFKCLKHTTNINLMHTHSPGSDNLI